MGSELGLDLHLMDPATDDNGACSRGKRVERCFGIALGIENDDTSSRSGAIVHPRPSLEAGECLCRRDHKVVEDRVAVLNVRVRVKLDRYHDGMSHLGCHLRRGSTILEA